MKNIDTRKAELVSLITKTEDAAAIKAIAKLVVRLDELATEESKLITLQEKIEKLTQEIAEELKVYQASVADKPKSTRGRKKKQIA